MLQGSLSLFLMRLFSQMYKCHKPQKHYHKTWLHKSSVSLYCVTRISILFLGHFTLHPSPPRPHPLFTGLTAPLSPSRAQSQSGESWPAHSDCTKPDQVNTLFPRIASSSELFALVTRESRRGEIWQHRHSQGLLHLLHHTQHLASPVYGPALLQQEHGHTITLIQVVLDFTFRNTDHSPFDNICSGVWMFQSFPHANSFKYPGPIWINVLDKTLSSCSGSFT